MTCKRLIYGSTLVSVLMPLAASAQTGMVTTSPLDSAGAPALGLPVLIVLALALGVATFYALRRRRMRAAVGVALVAAATGLVGISYAAIFNVVIDGNECAMTATNPWASGFELDLENQCPNHVKIVAIDADCANPVLTAPACTAGTTVLAGTTCNLPFCD